MGVKNSKNESMSFTDGPLERGEVARRQNLLLWSPKHVALDSTFLGRIFSCSRILIFICMYFYEFYLRVFKKFVKSHGDLST